MGVNAQTTVPAFVAGEVLTAAEMTQVNTGIPVFATTVTRDAAFGGAGEKVLAQGQYAHIEATNALQVYTGSAWTNFNSGSMVLITAQTIGTAVNAVTVSSAFSSTYDNYFVTVSGGSASTGCRADLTFGATATGYYSFGVYGNLGTATVNGEAQSNGSSLQDILQATSDQINGAFYVFSPNLAKGTATISNSVRPTTNGIATTQWGWLNNTTQYTAFTITLSAAATITGGTIRVYGLVNS